MIISGWGLNLKIDSKIEYLNKKKINKFSYKKKIIPRGMGRSYGDSSLQKRVIDIKKNNKIINFDKKKGIIHVSSGTTIKQINSKIIPFGWFLPVTPGSQYITVGGMIASNVHGKNQHIKGSFKNHVLQIKVITKDKTLNTLKKKNKNFYSFFGTMGLLGIILEAKIKLIKIESAFINQKTIVTKDLSSTLKVFFQTISSEYSVGWIDLTEKNITGKSIIFLGEHAKTKLKKNFFIKKEKEINIYPFYSIFFNRISIKIFNKLYYYYHLFFKNFREDLIDYRSFFYPLDNLKNWNNFYGKKGFLQYQFVLPINKRTEKVLLLIFQIIQKSQNRPKLCTIKYFKGENGNLNFYLEGFSLALDFSIDKNIYKILDQINNIVCNNNGKVYLTKDSFLCKKSFSKMYKISKYLRNKIKSKKAGEINLSSMQSERLGLT